MKVSCFQDNLARGLSIVSRAVSARSTLPVLSNVLLETDNGRLKLAATNLEISITCWIGAKVEEEGAITIPARTFGELVSTFPQEPVSLHLNKVTQTVHVSCGRTQANIKGIDAEEFPKIPAPNDANRIRMEPAVLKQIIGRVAFAAAVDDSRPVLTGVSTQFSGNKVTMAATDGFRLSVCSANVAATVDHPFSVIVPARSLAEVARIIGDDLQAVYISQPEGRVQLIFDMDNVVLVTQLIDGAFPDYPPVIPKHHNTRATLGTGDFRKACRTAEVFARDSSNTARISIEPGDGLAHGYAMISARSQEMGDNVAQIDASVEGKSIEIAFNVKYMADVLNVIDTPQVAVETTSAMEPGVIKPVGDNDYVYVIMPMHFNR